MTLFASGQGNLGQFQDLFITISAARQFDLVRNEIPGVESLPLKSNHIIRTELGLVQSVGTLYRLPFGFLSPSRLRKLYLGFCLASLLLVLVDWFRNRSLV